MINSTGFGNLGQSKVFPLSQPPINKPSTPTLLRVIVVVAGRHNRDILSRVMVAMWSASRARFSATAAACIQSRPPTDDDEQSLRKRWTVPPVPPQWHNINVVRRERGVLRRQLLPFCMMACRCICRASVRPLSRRGHSLNVLICKLVPFFTTIKYALNTRQWRERERETPLIQLRCRVKENSIMWPRRGRGWRRNTKGPNGE